MTQQQDNSTTSGNQPYAKQSGSGKSNMSSGSSLNQIEQAYASSNQAGTNTDQAQSGAPQQPGSPSSPQGTRVQAMSSETGLEYTADVIRQQKLKDKNQKATDSLVDRMYWQHEESLSKSVKVSDKGELENYDDTPGFGNDKPGL